MTKAEMIERIKCAQDDLDAAWQNFPRGLKDEAQALGVDRRHLWSVLTGRRTSRSLLARYGQLKKPSTKQEEQ